MTRSLYAVSILLLGLAVWPGVASAAIAEGAQRAAACTACHGPQGRSRGAVPSLAGMSVDRFEARMADFRRGDGTIMNRIAPAYDPAAVSQLARYFAAQPVEQTP